jgi:hypothetical protein
MKLKRGDLVYAPWHLKFGTVVMADKRTNDGLIPGSGASVKVVFPDGLTSWCSPINLIKQ